MSDAEGKYFDVSTGVPSDKVETLQVTGEFLEVACTLYYRGKTNGYVREQVAVETIVDKNCRVVAGIWNDEWSEAAPGIWTCNKQLGSRAGRTEQYKTETIRVHRSACPVHVHFSESFDYMDYDGDYSSSSSSDYWVRYEE
jgi:hypothetical protein